MNKPWIGLGLFLACVVGLGRGVEAGPLKVCLLSGSEEYESDKTLAAYKAFLESRYPVQCTLLKAEGTDSLPGLEALDDCDVALFFTRRLTIDSEQLDRVKKYVLAGRPIVAVRTACHGFQNWLEFDKLVLGGNYHGHYRNDLSQRARVVPEAKGHPIVQGIGTIASRGSLYKVSPLATDATVLMMSSSPEGNEPAAWTRMFRGGRVFFTSLGAQGDFENATFLRLLTNALFWASDRPLPEPPPAEQPALRPAPEGTIRLKLRGRVESSPGSGQWNEVTLSREVPAAETAIIICDMWDLHWCTGASKRCDAIAKRMDPVLEAARAKGVQIIHAPSETMDFYDGTPQRLRAQLAPTAPTALDPPARPPEPPLPIDDSDGGCDTDDTFYLAWTRQNPRLQIGKFDAVSDDGQEVFNLLHQLGVKHVLIMGVHTNMCVLNRSFAIRAMTRRGLNCILVRDLTDTMYDPKDPPHVSHDEGTALVVEHIEKYWCPSILSTDLLEGLPK